MDKTELIARLQLLSGADNKEAAHFAAVELLLRYLDDEMISEVYREIGYPG